MATPLSQSQHDIIDKIVDRGKLYNNYTDEQIKIAVNVAFIESSLNQSATNSSSTASGVYQYLDGAWATVNAVFGNQLLKTSADDQVTVFYFDLYKYGQWFLDANVQALNPPISLEEYVYFRHHNGAATVIDNNWQSNAGMVDYYANLPAAVRVDMETYTQDAIDDYDIANPPATGGGGGGGGYVASLWGLLYDPLVLDLNNDGVQLVGLSDSTAYFDLNATEDGFVTRTSWVSSNDAFLARDLNGDGTINDIDELFGNAIDHGLTVLAVEDINGDGVIDSDDAIFDELLLWTDANGDGISQAEELSTLAGEGIASIDLSFEVTEEPFSREGRIARTGTFVREDGSIGELADVEFAINGTFTNYVANYAFYSEVLAVENIKGYGSLPDLHIAMSLDEGFREFAISFLDDATVTGLIENFGQLMAEWGNFQDLTIEDLGSDSGLETDTQQVEYGITGEIFSLNQLGIIKEYLGVDELELVDAYRVTTTGQTSLQTIGEEYARTLDEISRNLLAKFAVANGLLSEVLPGMKYDFVTDSLYTNAELVEDQFDDIVESILDSAGQETLDTQLLAAIALTELMPELQSEFVNALGDQLQESQQIFNNSLFQLLGIGTNGDDNLYMPSRQGGVLVGNDGDDRLLGSTLDDELIGGNGNDRIEARRGDDELLGGDGDDLLLSQGGNDYADGGNGNDTVNGGLGHDEIYGGNGNDFMEAGSGNDYASGDNGEDTILGGVGRDVLDGGNGKDTLDGGSGNDTIDGGNGSDIITGGTGNDALTGGNGDDTFVYNSGDGADVITDFETGKDLIDLTGISVLEYSSLVMESANDDEATLVQIGENGSILLEGVSFSSLDEKDFAFA